MKNILKEKFNLLMILSIAFIALLILIFVFLNLNTASHVRFIEISGEQENVDLSNQKIKVYFSGPMNKDSSARFITVSPEISFTTSWANNTLFLILKQNLQSDTEYKITISPEMKDVYGKNLAQEYNYTFRTEKIHLAFIQSNETTKKIVLADSNLQNSKTLYESADLKLFALNKNFLAAVTHTDDLDNINIINLSNGSTQNLNLQSVQIDRIDFSPIANQFIYLTQKLEKKPGYVQPSDQININLYDIDQNQNHILNLETPTTQVIDIKYSPDGNSILYKDSTGVFYLLQVSDSSKQTHLGTFLADGGFNRDGTQIIFVAFDPLNTYTQAQYLVEYSSNRTQKNLTTGTFPVLDPQYYHNEDSIIYSEKYKDLASTKGIYQIVKLDQSLIPTVIVKDDQRSLELPKISPDDRYIAIERYTKDSLMSFDKQRIFLFQTKPSTADMVVWDSKDNVLIDPGVHGIEARWIF